MSSCNLDLQASPTRWGSTHKMIARILEQERAIRRVLSEDRKVAHLVLTWQDIDVLTSIHKSLEPMADFTDALSGDSYVTVSSIKPTLSFIKDATMATDDDTSLTEDLKASIRADFQKRYTSDVTQTLQNTATWLDPRYKTAYLTDEECRNATEKIKEEMITLQVERAGDAADAPDEARQRQNDAPNAPDNVEDDQPPAKKMKRSLATLLGQVKKSSASANPTTPAARIDLEMSRYVSAPEIGLDADPLQWWSMHATIYPSLAKLARKYLCVCGTSSASERLFSVAGNIVTAKRSLLKPHKVDMLVFLAKNL